MTESTMTREEALRIVANGLRAGGDYSDRDLDQEDAALAVLSSYGQPGECPDCPNYVGKCPRCHSVRPALATEMELMHETTDEDVQAINAIKCADGDAERSAPVTVGEVESAMGFCLRNSQTIDDCGPGSPSFVPLAKLIEARDTATTAAAERALLERMLAAVEAIERRWPGADRAGIVLEVFTELRSKLTQHKEPTNG